jgi:hypothetical protein
MKMRYVLITVLFLIFDHTMAESLFVNAIEFKGQAEQQRFIGRDFDIHFEEGKFKISQRKERGKEFVIKRSDDSIQDLVFSSDRSAIAVAMRATDSKNRRRMLVTINARGEETAFEYETYEMTERLGWVVELGAVSNDGDYILAKCALMLPANEAGVSQVQHKWTVLKISGKSVAIIDSVDAIDKWHSYAHAERPPEGLDKR